MPDFMDLPLWLRLAVGFTVGGLFFITYRLERIDRCLNEIRVALVMRDRGGD